MWNVVIIESECDGGLKVDSVEKFDTYDKAKSFQDAFNAYNPDVRNVPGWYMVAEEPAYVPEN